MISVRAGLVGAVVLMALLSGCDDPDRDRPKASPTASVADDKYCGLVTSDLIHSLLGREIETSGDVLSEAPTGPGVVDCTINAAQGRGYVTVIVDPVLEGETPPEAGECEPVSIPGWGSVMACWNNTYVSVLASPPEKGRFIRINLRLDEAGTQVGPPSDETRTESTDAAVRVVQDVNTNVNRF